MSDKKEDEDKYQGIPIQRLPSMGTPYNNKGHRYKELTVPKFTYGRNKARKILKIIAALKD